jgi:hypothetical protein
MSEVLEEEEVPVETTEEVVEVEVPQITVMQVVLEVRELKV